MTTAPFVFKSKAMRTLRGNWQTALLVSFLANMPGMLFTVLRVTKTPEVFGFSDIISTRLAYITVAPGLWVLMVLLSLAAYLMAPALQLGCNLYFIERVRKKELGLQGLFSRMRYWWKALLLYLLIAVKIFLWSLLLIVPGYIASLRYSLAPYYLAQDPQQGVLEVLNRSKQTMQDKKGTLFLLYMSFIILWLMMVAIQLLLWDSSPVLAMVLAQCIQLYMITYLNAAVAVFYLAASRPNGMHAAQSEAKAWVAHLRGNPGGERFDRDDDSSGKEDE